jgi:lipopolysaccharide transport system ATP-binding protein
MSIVISVENLSKVYRLGQIGTGTFSYDLNVWWAKVRGKPNPLLRIGETDHGNRDGEEIWALRDVSFMVEQGEVLGIIGRNGAGKSTLLKILSRVTAPTSGKVKVKGRVASLLEVGTGFHPELTGRENIYLNGAILGMSRREIDWKFDEIVDFSGVEEFIDTPVKRYSSGMYVRLAFAVAAHLDPEILVVDEVLAVGDAEFQKKCLGKMGEVAQGGRTVLFVSHNMAAVSQLCHKTILLDMGEVKQSGITDDIVFAYLKLNIDKNFSHQSGQSNITLNEQPQLTEIIVRNSRGEYTDTILSGEKILIELSYMSTRKKPLQQVSVSIIFANEFRENIFCCWSDLVTSNFNNLSPTGKFVCEISKLALAPGKYYLTFNLIVDKVRTDKKEDWYSINVIAGNFFSTGKIPPRRLGNFYVEHNWTHYK